MQGFVGLGSRGVLFVLEFRSPDDTGLPMSWQGLGRRVWGFAFRFMGEFGSPKALGR